MVLLFGLLAGGVLLHVEKVYLGLFVQAVGHCWARVSLAAVAELGRVARATIGAG
jgi:hypothetical protein